MAFEPNDVLLPDDDRNLDLSEVAERSGLTEIEVRELVECGVLLPSGGPGGECVFGWRSITVARTARRLGEEFDLEPHGVAVLLKFAERIRELEDELRALRARLGG